MNFGSVRSVVAATLVLGVLLSTQVEAESFIYYEDEMGRSANPIHELSMSDVRLNELIHGSLWAPNYADQPQPVLVKEAKLSESGRELEIELDVA